MEKSRELKVNTTVFYCAGVRVTNLLLVYVLRLKLNGSESGTERREKGNLGLLATLTRRLPNTWFYSVRHCFLDNELRSTSFHPHEVFFAYRFLRKLVQTACIKI